MNILATFTGIQIEIMKLIQVPVTLSDENAFHFSRSNTSDVNDTHQYQKYTSDKDMPITFWRKNSGAIPEKFHPNEQ